MYGFYTPVLIFQALCVYHAYKNNAEQRWYWFILLFPMVGGILYIFHTYGNRQSLNTLAEGVKVIVNSSYEIEKYELALKHSENFTNKINLADAYMRVERFDDAIRLYRENMAGFMAGDVPLRLKLLQAHFLKKEYDVVIEIGDSLRNEKAFQNTEEKVAYAWALHHIGKSDQAEAEFEKLDKPYTNYKQRLEYCKFLHLKGNAALMNEKLTELLEEFDSMQSMERKIHKPILKELRELRGITEGK